MAQTETPIAMFRYWLDAETPAAQDTATQMKEPQSIESRMRASKFTEFLFAEGNESLAVRQVTFREAMKMADFFTRLMKERQQGISPYEVQLPSPDEFEFSLRSGSKTKYHFGDESVRDYLNNYAVFNSDYVGGDKVVEDNSFASYPTRLGAFNQIGNLTEYVRTTNGEGGIDTTSHCLLMGGDPINPSNFASTHAWRGAITSRLIPDSGFRVVMHRLKFTGTFR